MIVSGELVAGLLTNGVSLLRRGPFEVEGGLPEGARFVYAEVDRHHGQVAELVLIFEHDEWQDSADGSILTLSPKVRELSAQ